jgi:acetyl esterase/lipase
MSPHRARGFRLRSLLLATAGTALLASSAAAEPPAAITLWRDRAPGTAGAEVVRLSERGDHIVSNVHSPSITPFIPAVAAANGAAVIVIPGGGHAALWMDHEGYRVADVLVARGIAAFVLKYRLARDKDSNYTIEGDELADVQRAIRLVRSRAGEWGVDPRRVGVIGFSAGGELAVLAATHFDAGDAAAGTPVDRASSRPDFAALVYPAFPSTLDVSSATPPMFLLCGGADSPAVTLGVANLFEQLERAGVPAELHVYAGVGHGFGIRASEHGPITGWPQRLIEWLDAQGFLARH